MLGLSFNWSGKSEFPSTLNRCELAKVQWEWSHLQPLPSWSNRLDTQGDILGVICNFQLGGLRFALCMCACLCPSFGRYTEIKANAGDPDQDCGKIVTIEGISGFGRNPTRVRKPARRHSQNLHVQTFANLRCGLCWSMPREQLWISCEPPAAALSWMNFYFAGFDLLTHQWQISSYTLHILHFHRHDIRQMESKPCFEEPSDCHEMEIWDLSVSLKQMFPRVRLVDCRCTAGNYHRKLSGFPVVALLPVVSACCQARMSFFLHHVATNYILKKSPLLLSQLSWQAFFLAACQKRANQIWNRNMRLCLVFSSQF